MTTATAPSGVARAEDLTPGTRVLYASTPCKILSGPDTRTDKFGRPVLVFRARREDTGATGALLFGPGALVDLALDSRA